uniref:KIB1-4 beta-propeller domain-containing protein n=1 Tax=Oryza barthii TaxID=65489 RepID=A0A0D3FPR5_9ORYZ
MDKTNRVPCLALYVKHGAGSDKPALFSISEKRAINNNIPGLTNTNSWVTPHGWILVLDTASTATFLQNPHDSTDKIQLPHRTCTAVPHVCSPASPDPWLCRLGPSLGWQGPREGADMLDRQGKFYFNGGFESIGVLEFSPSPTFSCIAIIDPIIGGLGVMGMASLYMVESLDELYMVCQMYDSDMKTIYDVTVYRMDFLKQQWCIAEDIGGRAFLVASCYFGASRSADECGLEKDCVYSIFARDKYFEVCKVEDGETEEYDLIEAPDSQGGMWILPVEKK